MSTNANAVNQPAVSQPDTSTANLERAIIKRQAVKKLLVAFLEAISVADPSIGAPGGVMYAAVSGQMNLELFERFMSSMIEAGLTIKRGLCYFPTPMGAAFLKTQHSTPEGEPSVPVWQGVKGRRGL